MQNVVDCSGQELENKRGKDESGYLPEDLSAVPTKREGISHYRSLLNRLYSIVSLAIISELIQTLNGGR